MKQATYITCDSVTRERTPEGFLKVIVRAGRAGIQRYRCSQIGVPDVNGTGFVNVLRHPDDVFDQVSLDSLHGKDVTLLHPKEKLVTSSNHAKLSKGSIISPGSRVDDDIYVEAIVKDNNAIDTLEKGFSRVSLGYTNDYLRQDGEWSGVSYQYRQKDILYNHLALVPKGRAGERYVVLDEEESFMNEDEKAAFKAEIVQEVVAAFKEVATPETPSVTHDEMDKMLEERSEVITKAKLLKPDIVTTNKSNEQIMRESLGDTVTLDHSDEIVKYAFNSARVENKQPSEPKKLNLAGPSSTSATTLDAEDITREANEVFKHSTNRGFDSLRKQLKGEQ